MVAKVSRSAWGANPLNTPAGTIATPAPDIWLHHVGSTGLHGASGMRSIQAGAIAGGYVDIEYTYIVDTDGVAYVARGPGRNTAATGSYNPTSHALCAFGNYEVEQPTDELIDTLAALVVELFETGYARSPRITGSHSAVYATACAGRNLAARIGEINELAAHGAPSSPNPTPKGGAVDLCSTPTGDGYWIVDQTGAVFAFGAAKYLGGANTAGKLAAPIVAMAARPQGDGYWLAAADGGVFAYGGAPFKGSMGGKALNSPIVGIAADDGGAGYWLLGADGGVFAFGSAPFKGAATGLVH